MKDYEKAPVMFSVVRDADLDHEAEMSGPILSNVMALSAVAENPTFKLVILWSAAEILMKSGNEQLATAIMAECEPLQDLVAERIISESK